MVFVVYLVYLFYSEEKEVIIDFDLKINQVELDSKRKKTER